MNKALYAHERIHVTFKVLSAIKLLGALIPAYSLLILSFTSEFCRILHAHMYSNFFEFWQSAFIQDTTWKLHLSCFWMAFGDTRNGGNATLPSFLNLVYLQGTRVRALLWFFSL